MKITTIHRGKNTLASVLRPWRDHQFYQRSSKGDIVLMRTGYHSDNWEPRQLGVGSKLGPDVSSSRQSSEVTGEGRGTDSS